MLRPYAFLLFLSDLLLDVVKPLLDVVLHHHKLVLILGDALVRSFPADVDVDLHRLLEVVGDLLGQRGCHQLYYKLKSNLYHNPQSLMKPDCYLRKEI